MIEIIKTEIMIGVENMIKINKEEIEEEWTDWEILWIKITSSMIFIEYNFLIIYLTITISF